jgi:hypothetical protein
MKRAAIALLLITNYWMTTAFLLATGNAKPQAKEVVAKCIDAMGGMESFRNVKTLSYHSWSHTLLRDISPSASLPALFAYESKDVVLRPQAQTVNEKASWQWTESATSSVSVLTITPEGGFVERDGKRTPVSADRFYGAVDLLSANPVSALLAAADSSDLQLTQQGPQTYEISFLQTVYGQKVKTNLGIDRQSYRVQWVEIKHSYAGDLYSAVWGGILKRFDFASFVLDSTGLYFPAKWKLSTNGLEDGQVSLVNVKVNSSIEANPGLPAEFKNSFAAFLELSPRNAAKRNIGESSHLELGDGMVMLPGKERAYNSVIVKQDKGIVIVEGPYSNANSELVMQYAKNLYPNAPIVGVVSTDYFTFHLAGLPLYGRAGVPLYVLDANVDRVRQVLSKQAPESSIPALAVKLRVVRDRTEIGTGPNRMVLLPFHGTASSKMMAVYFPERKFLYCSDLYLPVAWGHDFWTEHLSEIRDLIEQENLEVRQVAGVSVPPQDWKELAASLPARANNR